MVTQYIADMFVQFSLKDMAPSFLNSNFLKFSGQLHDSLHWIEAESLVLSVFRVSEYHRTAFGNSTDVDGQLGNRTRR